jgi:hypothetical protein
VTPSDFPDGLMTAERFGNAAILTIEVLEREGIDISDIASQLRGIADRCFPRELAHAQELIDAELSATFVPTEAQIEACYRRLRNLPPESDAYVQTLARLRKLQQAEADALSATFRSRAHLDSAAAERALERARQLLAAHEDPAGDH